MFTLETEVSWKVVPFVATAVVVAIFVLAWTAGAEEPKAVVYTGPAGSYVPAQGEIVQQFEDGRLLVTRAGGQQVIIDLSGQLSAPAPAPVPSGETFVYQNGQRVGAGSTVYVDPRHQIELREQDLRELEVLAEIDLDQREQDLREREQRSREYERRAERRQREEEDERRAEERERRDRQDRRERARRDFSRDLDSARRSGERARDDFRRDLRDILKSR